LSYPKSIETLVDDIYSLFNGHTADPVRAAAFGQAVADIIVQRLAETDRKFTLRMSAVGKPDRKLWYEANATDKEKLPPNVRMKFLYGDILECLLLFLATEAGHTVENQQGVVEVNGILGHLDGVIDGALVDVKSASTHSFRKFKEGNLADDDPFGYMEQLAGYNEGVKADRAGFLVIDKTLGHIVFNEIPVDDLKALNVPERIEHLKEVVASPDIPERCYSPVPDGESGNMRLNTNCSYCDFKFDCWKDANNGIGLRTFLYSKGPTHFTHIEKEPRVMEITF
jgi:hypothetical protein